LPKKLILDCATPAYLEIITLRFLRIDNFLKWDNS